MFFWGDFGIFWKFELTAVRRVLSVPNSLGPLGGLRPMLKEGGSKEPGQKLTRVHVRR